MLQNDNFTARLQALKIKKTEFARLIGVSIYSVYRWKDNPPQWALVILGLIPYERKFKHLQAEITRIGNSSQI